MYIDLIITNIKGTLKQRLSKRTDEAKGNELFCHIYKLPLIIPRYEVALHINTS